MNRLEGGLSLESIERLHGDELARISHALKTPLTSIIGFASAMLNDPEISHETSVEFSRIIKSEGERLSRFVDELLYISFGDSSKTHEAVEPVDPVALVQTAVRVVSAKMNQPSSRFEMQIESLPHSVHLEKEFVIKMLCNVISNAARFSAHHSPVTINGSLNSGRLSLQIISLRRGFNLDLRTASFPASGDIEAIGLARTRHLLSLRRGDLAVDTVDHNKTAVSLLFPLEVQELIG